jgi:hypothetical protein
MAKVTFDGNPVAEARALLSVLSLWLSEQEPPLLAPPATARCTYTDDGDLRTLTVTLDEAK